MRLHEFAKRVKEQAIAKWTALAKAYLRWKEKPSFKTFCKVAKFLVQVFCTALVKKIFDWILSR